MMMTACASNLADRLGGIAGLWNPALTGSAVAEQAESATDSETEQRASARADVAWVQRVRAGDEEAARSLVVRLYPTILKSIRCHLPRRTSEEDLAQAVFAKIFTNLHQFSGLVPLEHWVSRITINTCLSQLKHETVRPELRMSDLSEEESVVLQHLAVTEDDLPREQGEAARELLSRLLARLKPDERLVISMLHLEERSAREISRLTGWSVSRVKVKAFRARRKMRRICETLIKETGEEFGFWAVAAGARAVS